ncbi:eukaryotic translation initiation factor 2B subunit delta isoform X2 [Andrena cerasifolii]|uniref:eukaryotic translation initiation factor 2B subunit delta isoform X2 n=1 Tax=Andrena cerasifolii TaxID=2819439 RepID=UPI004037FABE
MRTDTVTMDQEEHLTEKGEAKFFTRATARHLRRKRLQDARKAAKEQECSINGVSFKPNEDSISNKNTDQPEVITKSKARRIRKKNKAKLLQNCCSSCESYHKSSSLTIEAPSDQEVFAEKDADDLKTITKSKARRLRKKNKTKLVQNTCSFCYNTYSSPIDPILLKYIKTTEYDSVCCAKLETDIVNNLKQNYKPEKTVEAQACNVEYDKKTEQAELKKLENIETQGNYSELSCLSRSPGPLIFRNEVQTCNEKRERNSEDSPLASQLEQTIVETILTRINCTKEDTRSQRFDTKELQEIEIPANLVELDQSTEFYNAECANETNFNLESRSTESKENNTSLEDKAEPESFLEVDTQRVTPLFSKEELLENTKNLKFCDTLENNLKSTAQENTRMSPDSIEPQSKNSIPVVREITKGANSTEEQSETGSVSNSDSIASQSLKEAEATKAKVPSTRNIEKSSIVIPSLSIETVELGRPVASSLKLPTLRNMADNKSNVLEKTREEIKAEREAKKAAKALAKVKAKTAKVQEKDTSNTKPALPDSTESKGSGEKSESLGNENVQVEAKAPATKGAPEATVCEKNAPPEVNTEGKSKAELRTERRAKQEAQRVAKQQGLQEKNKVKSKEGSNNKSVVEITNESNSPKKIVTPKKSVRKENSHELNLFKHLYHERERANIVVPSVNSDIHPAILRLGVQYAEKVIVGSNARCVALLATVKQLIRDFERPPQVDFIRGLEASLQKSVAYLHFCRPVAVSMQNALRHLKWQMTQLPSALSDADAKSKLSSAIDTYILEQIQLAGKAISITIQTKISNGDVILTYSYSSLIHKILLDAHKADKQFRVIVVDGRPWLEGKEQLRRLAKDGIECSYILINALSYVMPEVSKVFLGAHAILANGAVMSRVGTAQVALMARAFNIPVLVACETHKSCERVQTDSIVYNELGNADELARSYEIGAKKPLLAKWKTKRLLNLLNITYDVTPADLVTAVVTELAILPCTSVPVILRIKPSEI